MDRPPAPPSLETLSSMKPVPGAKMAGATALEDDFKENFQWEAGHSSACKVSRRPQLLN